MAENKLALSRFQATVRALRHRNFRLFFLGQLVSLIGTWMQTVAQSWLVYRLTGSSALLGSVNFASQIPVFLLSPAGGVVADRYNRHRLVIATQAASMLLALVLAGLTLFHMVKVWQIFVLSALLGIVNAFDIPARQAFIVEMTSREDLINAIALNSSAFNGARIVGPAVAGILVAAVGEGWCFFANGVSYIAVIAGLLAMKLQPYRPRHVESSVLRHIGEGFRFIADTAPIRALLLLVGLVSLAGMPYSVLMPIFADRILNAGAQGLGILMGISGLGALAGALLLASRQTVRGLGRWIVISSASFSALLIVFAYSRWFWLSAAVLVPIGFSVMIQMGSTNTLIQSMTPDAMRGRVLAGYSMMLMGMAPIGALIAGVLAEHIGARATVSAGALACGAAAAAFALHLPGIRQEARELILAQSATIPPEAS
ncbi:MAG TPA: MFS transporter [Bryobacteraceae bacterium]|nr:MFS transporter [Bryobacteraceae bacterium]